MMRHISLFLLLIVLTGCTSFGPVSSPNFPQLVAAAVAETDGKIQLYGEGFWYPHPCGLKDPCGSIHSDSVAFPGIVVITTKAILFQEWDQNKNVFYVRIRWHFSELESATLVSYGRNRRIVVRKSLDLSYDSFNFAEAGGILIDPVKTEKAYTLLPDQIKQ